MNKILNWFLSIGIVTAIALLVYGAVQQNIRLSANDPQIEIAENTATGLAQGGTLSPALFSSMIDISKSLSPFVIAYDASGTVQASQAELGNKIPELPQGVLTYAKQHGEDRLTWQPNDTTRIAAVVTYYSGTQSGYILAGRSIKEVESRESKIQFDIIIAWLALIILVTIKHLINWKNK